jgi:flavodoxin
MSDDCLAIGKSIKIGLGGKRMKKVLVAYFSEGGTTAKMGQFIAEGVRFSGSQAVTKSIGEIKTVTDLSSYDGYIFGSPTYHQDTASPMKAFLDLAKKGSLKGKLAGAFSSYHHEIGYTPGVQAADLILEAMKSNNQMEPFELGALKLTDIALATADGMRACQDYGKVFGEKLG